jgi:hypothetical protein
VLEKGLSSLIEMSADGRPLFEATLNLPGRHTMLNATAAAALASALGVELESIRQGIENYRGVKRRFEKREVIDGVEWFDDYAHHPTEVKMTLETAREIYPGRKIWALFQPHQAIRLEYFFQEFAESFQNGPVRFGPAQQTPLQASAISVLFASPGSPTCDTSAPRSPPGAPPPVDAHRRSDRVASATLPVAAADP